MEHKLSNKEELDEYCTTMNSGRQAENMPIYQVRKVPETVDHYELYVN